MNQIMFLLFLPAHIVCDPLNLTSFAVLSDAGGDSFEMIEWDDEGKYAGGGYIGQSGGE